MAEATVTESTGIFDGEYISGPRHVISPVALLHLGPWPNLPVGSDSADLDIESYDFGRPLASNNPEFKLLPHDERCSAPR